MSDKEILDAINENFKGLVFDYIEYSDTHDDYELHFKGKEAHIFPYFCLGVKLKASFRQVQVAKELIEE